MDALDQITIPNHPTYKDGMFLWTSKVMTMPDYWSRDRKKNEAITRGTERILKGVIERYGEERELRERDVVHIGKIKGESAFVLIAYVPCNDDERPEQKLIIQ